MSLRLKEAMQSLPFFFYYCFLNCSIVNFFLHREKIDRVYVGTPTKIAIIDHEKKRTLVMRKDGLPDAGKHVLQSYDVLSLFSFFPWISFFSDAISHRPLQWCGTLGTERPSPSQTSETMTTTTLSAWGLQTSRSPSI